MYPFKSFMHERVSSRQFFLKNVEPSSYGFPLDWKKKKPDTNKQTKKKSQENISLEVIFFCWDTPVLQLDYAPCQSTA